VPGTRACGPDKTPRTCSKTGRWVNEESCEVRCQDGECAGGPCMPGETRCARSRMQRCGADGQWEKGAKCPGECVGNACGGS
jgi:hypothetical protein